MTTWRRWLRNVLVAAAATVVLTATGVLPAAVAQVVDLAGFLPSSQLLGPLHGHHAACEDAFCGDAHRPDPV